jgi:hypothetical protein
MEAFHFLTSLSKDAVIAETTYSVDDMVMIECAVAGEIRIGRETEELEENMRCSILSTIRRTFLLWDRTRATKGSSLGTSSSA